MSLDATRWAWEQKNITPLEKLLLLSLADRAGESHEAWPSWSRLMADTGAARNTIHKCLLALQEKGLIIKSGTVKQVIKYKLIGVKGRDEELQTSSKMTTGKNSTSIKMTTGTSSKMTTGNLSLESKDVRTYARTLFLKYKIIVPPDEIPLSETLINQATTCLASIGMTLEAYLKFISIECSKWATKSWQSKSGAWKQNTYDIILDEKNIKKACNGNFLDKKE